jgi:CysZ protein
MNSTSPVPTFAPKGGFSDFFQGLGLLGRAFGLIFRSPKLFALSALCAVVTFVTLVGLALWLVGHVPAFVTHFFPEPASWYGRALWIFTLILTFLALFVVGANVLPSLLLAPLQDPLSEATEALCGGFESPPFRVGAFLRGLVTGVAHTLARIFFLLGGLAVLFPLNLIPGVGSVAWTVLGSVWTMTWMAGEHLATPMTRHTYAFSQVRRALTQRWALCLGFGAGVYVLLWVPIINTFFLPVAVVAGTLLYRGLLAAGTLPPPPDASPIALK